MSGTIKIDMCFLNLNTYAEYRQAESFFAVLYSELVIYENILPNRYGKE